MKKGYIVTLSLRYIEDVEIETEEEDEEKIKLEAKDAFNIDVWDRERLDEIIEGVQAVKIERNYSEESEFQRWREEDRKKYLVTFTPTCCDLEIEVSANDEEEAEEMAEENIETEFISKDGKTECVVVEHKLKDIGVIEEEKES